MDREIETRESIVETLRRVTLLRKNFTRDWWIETGGTPSKGKRCYWGIHLGRVQGESWAGDLWQPSNPLAREVWSILGGVRVPITHLQLWGAVALTTCLPSGRGYHSTNVIAQRDRTWPGQSPWMEHRWWEHVFGDSRPLSIQDPISSLGW